ncbi:HutD family protein [Pseudomonas sp. J452]|uniref:HutD/Ves family protein n=1 Tax=Pseudomonas sp. J452 TaxID=2898441 RepID=UPI0021AE1053|nr:HutD family protein [Pseudomonas sp. J452]UUY10272.1 HutD family protein [Pseudomonas sp. J452]
MPIQRLDRHQARQMPWKNGGGITCELAIAPAGAGLEDFAWRISCAQIASGGPFSRFAGVDRSLALLEGAGLDLRLNGQPRQLRPGDPPLIFAGEDEVSAELLDGPVGDFNLMTRRSAWRHQLQRLQLDGAQTLHNDADILLIYCQRGRVTVQLADASVQTLGEGQGLLLENESTHLTLSGAAENQLYIGHLYRQP